MKRTCVDYLEDILLSISDLEEFTKDLSFEQFISDRKTVLASRSALQVIGEASNKIPVNVRKEHTHIPWKYMIGLRNRIVHEYFGLRLKVIWEIIHKELPGLKPQISQMIMKLKEDQRE